LLRFIGLCFHHKRKTIRNNLAGVCGKEAIDAWPEAGLRGAIYAGTVCEDVPQRDLVLVRWGAT
jgi:16S rRNA A1518/A1519 N6-dimethyltransferase RsmA/KsgA/DIM1 with predicted DNA glycosylase/AP lyase activity